MWNQKEMEERKEVERKIFVYWIASVSEQVKRNKNNNGKKREKNNDENRNNRSTVR